MIYEHVLGGKQFELGDWKLMISDPDISLLLVNRQINSEAALILYSSNTFWADSQRVFDEFVQRRTQEQLNTINTIGLRTFRGREMMAEVEPVKVQTLAFLATTPNITRIYVRDWIASQPRVKVVANRTELEQHIRAWRPEVDIRFIDHGSS
jgi:hypothetical protein